MGKSMTDLQKFFYPNGAIRILVDRAQATGEKAGAILHVMPLHEEAHHIIVRASEEYCTRLNVRHYQPTWVLSTPRENHEWEWVYKPEGIE